MSMTLRRDVTRCGFGTQDYMRPKLLLRKQGTTNSRKTSPTEILHIYNTNGNGNNTVIKTIYY